MKLDKSGREFIVKHEGCRLKSYRDSAGIATIGVGHVSRHVHDGMTITQEEADRLFAHDVQWAERAVNKYVKVKLTQNEFTALCSFVFNVGTGAFHKSTLLNVLNDQNYRQASDELGKWIHADHRVIAGLVTRREEERQLFVA